MTTTKKKTRVLNAPYRGNLKYFVRKKVLNYRETKPTVYGFQVMRGPVVKGEALIEYAAKAAAVPPTTIKMAQAALFDAISYFCANGRSVQVPGLGSFAIRSQVKVAQTPEGATVDDTLKNRVMSFWPSGKLKDSGLKANVNFTEDLGMSKIALGTTDYNKLHPQT